MIAYKCLKRAVIWVCNADEKSVVCENHGYRKNCQMLLNFLTASHNLIINLSHIDTVQLCFFASDFEIFRLCLSHCLLCNFYFKSFTLQTIISFPHYKCPNCMPPFSLCRSTSTRNITKSKDVTMLRINRHVTFNFHM